MKFRIYDKIKKEYVDQDACSLHIFEDFYVSASNETVAVYIGAISSGLGMFEQREDCIAQRSTGLFDEKGVEIYEGDFVQWWWNSEEDGYGPGGSGGHILQDGLYEIIFNNGSFGFLTKKDWIPLWNERVEIVKHEV